MDDRMDRLNGSPPLEGLAASLQARVIAQLKSKEEDDERHRRADLMAIHSSGSGNSIQLVQTPHLKADKYPSGLKRTSPIIENPPRPPKMLYTDCSDGMINPDLLHASGGRVSSGPSSRNLALISPETNSLSGVGDDRHHLLRHGRNDVDVGTTPVAKGGNLLLSKHPQQHQQQQQQHHQQHYQQLPTSSSSSATSTPVKVINLPYEGGTMNSATTGCSSSSVSTSRNYAQHQQYRIQKPTGSSRPPPVQQQHHQRPHGGGPANKYHPNSYPSK